MIFAWDFEAERWLLMEGLSLSVMSSDLVPHRLLGVAEIAVARFFNPSAEVRFEKVEDTSQIADLVTSRFRRGAWLVSIV